jgi:transposase
VSRKQIDEVKKPDPEVVPLAQRRQFTAEEKLRILDEADACTEPGEMGALLRRNGIYSSYLTRWRRARDRGQLSALGAKKRGPTPPADKGLQREVAKLRRENERLQIRLAQAETIIEAQKKLSQLLGLNIEENGRNEKP